MHSPPISHLVFRTHPPLIYLFGFHHPGFSLYVPLSSSFSFFGCVPDRGFLLSPFSLVFCQRNTCCRILPSRIAEFSCLLNLFTTLNVSFPLSSITSLQPYCTSVHSGRSHSFPSSRVSVSLLTQHVHACTQLQERQEPFTVKLFQYNQALSLFPPIDDNFIPSLSPFKVTPFYRRGPRVTRWIGLPRFLPTTISLLLSHMVPFIPYSCVRIIPKSSQSCHVSISFRIVPRCLPASETLPVRYKMRWRLVSTKKRGMYSKLYRKGITEGPRCPAQSERKGLILEKIGAHPAVLVLRRVIERARRTRLHTYIMGRAGTRGISYPLHIRPGRSQRGGQIIRIRTFSAGSEPTQERPPKPFDLISSRFLDIFDVARLIGLLVLPKVEGIVEQEPDLYY